MFSFIVFSGVFPGGVVVGDWMWAMKRGLKGDAP